MLPHELIFTKDSSKDCISKFFPILWYVGIGASAVLGEDMIQPLTVTAMSTDFLMLEGNRRIKLGSTMIYLVK